MIKEIYEMIRKQIIPLHPKTAQKNKQETQKQEPHTDSQNKFNTHSGIRHVFNPSPPCPYKQQLMGPPTRPYS